MVGETLAGLGVDLVFGVVGSGNFHVTNALVRHGARFVATRHEAGAATAADAYARVSGRVGVVSVHQGCGLTNAMTGITEAAKSRTPLIVLAAEATAARSNFRVDQDALAQAVGASSDRVHSPETAVADTVRAWQRAVSERRTVVLNLPLDVQAAPRPEPASPSAAPSSDPATPSAAFSSEPATPSTAYSSEPATPSAAPALPSGVTLASLAGLLVGARRPVFIAGRGALDARAELESLASTCGALLATSAVAKGLFTGNPWNLDVSGGFATPLAAELIAGADVVVAWGASLTMWTTRHGALLSNVTTVVQVDLDPSALGAHQRIDLGIVGDVRATAMAVQEALTLPAAQAAPPATAPPATAPPATAPPATAPPATAPPATAPLTTAAAPPTPATAPPTDQPAPSDGVAGPAVGYRTNEVRSRLAAESRWRDVPYADDGDATHIDPRTATIALDDLIPADRVVAVDSGNFMGYPSMFLSVPDHRGFCFTQAFQSVGLGLATAIGAALATPTRIPVAACGDGGFLMGLAELDTVRRLGLGMLIVIYNDDAYGAEVHHFGPAGHPLSTVVFPETDLAAIARGHGCAGVTVRGPGDFAEVAAWAAGPRDVPMVVDLKVAASRPSWWLEEAFRGH